MVKYFLALFIIVPIIEVWLLIQVGQQIGGLMTVTLVIATAVIGSYWLRAQGVATIGRIQQSVASGGLPAAELIEGGMLLVAGALLITPGFFTDAVGALLLWPPSRRWFAAEVAIHVIQQFARNIQSAGQFNVQSEVFSTDFRQPSSESDPIGDTASHDTIEGEFLREDDESGQ